MKTYLVLLRGVNVGGKNILPMKELKNMLEQQGYQAVNTYIQSGNIVLQATKLNSQTISELIATNFSFVVDVMILTAQQFEQCVANNPYPTFAGNTVHFYFCAQTPNFDEQKANALLAEGEAYQLIDDVLYLHAANGIGRSKLAAKLESCLGVSVTARNLNTVLKLQQMLRAC